MLNHRFNIYDYRKQKPFVYKNTNTIKRIYSAPIINEFKKIQHENIKKSDNRHTIPKKQKSKLCVNTRKRAQPEYYNPKNFDERRYNIYQKSKYIYIPIKTQPRMGWLQLCINCYNITGQTIEIKNKLIYACNKCKKKKTERELYYISKDIENKINQYHVYNKKH